MKIEVKKNSPLRGDFWMFQTILENQFLLHDLILYFFKIIFLEHKLKFNEADNTQLAPESPLQKS